MTFKGSYDLITKEDIMKYICFEGTEGVGKTTQVSKMINYLKNQNYNVVSTKEPGSPISPLTLKLRNLILDAKYDKENGYLELLSELELTIPQTVSFGKKLLETAYFLIQLKKKHSIDSRELILQAVRFLHLMEIKKMKDVDYLIQDRGIMSGICYGLSNNVDLDFMESINNQIIKELGFKKDLYSLYDQIIILEGNTATGLLRATSAKKEFDSGDVMENKGNLFLENVSNNFKHYENKFKNVLKVNVEQKSIDEVFEELKAGLI